MPAADYRERISVQESVEEKDEEAIFQTLWKEYRKFYAALETLRGREYFAAAAVNAEQSVRFRLRYNSASSKITAGMRVEHRGVIYDIESATNVDGRNIHMVLMCKGVVSGGN